MAEERWIFPTHLEAETNKAGNPNMTGLTRAQQERLQLLIDSANQAAEAGNRAAEDNLRKAINAVLDHQKRN